MTLRTISYFMLLILPSIILANDKTDAEHMKFFETKVRPLLAAECVQCHGEKKQKGELRLDSLEMMLKGGESGPALVPGNLEESLIIEAINYESFEMPPQKQLSTDSIGVLASWIKMGAPWPENGGHPIRSGEREFTDEDRNWWAIQPVVDPAVPAGDEDWGRNEIDSFVTRKLNEAGLKPAPEADRHELVRRAYFDLHGLPPTPEQVLAFVNDQRPDAWQRLIRELLESPRYGERWAQHWLDVVRFAESDGYNEDAFRPGASAFRDYVIRSLNDDKPYNQLVREHLAGDEIAPDDPDVFIGTAYLRHGVYEWNQRNARMHWDLIVNEMTRVTGEAFLGIGIGCAQCHDHKFDPILQKDYYSLQAFLSSVSWPMETPLATPDELAIYQEKQNAWEQSTQSIRDEMFSLTKAESEKKQQFIVRQFPEDVQEIYYKPAAEKNTFDKQLSYLVERQVKRGVDRLDYSKLLKKKPEELKRYQQLQSELKKYKSLKPAPLPKAFVATDFGPDPASTFLLTRTTKEPVEPGFLALLGEETPQIKSTSTTTGRRTVLADWLTREDNPLSTRVIVNRVWQRHFGKGIVATPNDFGTLGEPPSHPQLLDWLTSRFLERGWKLKPLHELIMNSASYRQTTRREPGEHENITDPENSLLWRFRSHRLDAEQVRDAMLAVSGELKNREGGSSVSGDSSYRSIYVKKLRNKPDEMLSGFDAPLGFESAPDRIATTTPIQSLLLVNGDWTIDRSREFAKKILAGKPKITPDDINRAYEIALGRSASDEELREAIEFIHQQEKIGPTKAKVVDKFPNETGLRPLSQHFSQVKEFGLKEKSLWIQPGSRFERLQIEQELQPGDEFTVEAVTILDRLYPDASVNTLLSRWTGGSKSNGWSIGVTSKKSAYQPRNLIVQLVGRTFQDEPAYEVVASDLRFPLNKPVYIAVVISATTSKSNKTNGKVTFYMKDLSDPGAKLEKSVVTTSVVDQIQNPKLKMIAGGRTGRGHRWDGQVARLTISQNALPETQLISGNQSDKARRIVDWTFSGNNGEHPAQNAAWVRESPKENSSRILNAVTDFCHALFNSNEFLYLH